jgi:hypothetical protein
VAATNSFAPDLSRIAHDSDATAILWFINLPGERACRMDAWLTDWAFRGECGRCLRFSMP